VGLEDQVRAAADELEIRNLLAKLAEMADAGALDDYIDLFTEDASWGGAGQLQRTGHAEILDGARERRAGGITGPGSHTLHVLTTTAVELDGDRARSRSVFHFYANTDATPTLQVIGVYQDRFRRTSRGWKLSARVIDGPVAPPPAE